MDINRTDNVRNDADLIEEEDGFPEAQGRAGGNLARDVATENELQQVPDPEAHSGGGEQKDIDNDVAFKPTRVADNSG